MANKRISGDWPLQSCLNLRMREILIEVFITDLYFSKLFRGFSETEQHRLALQLGGLEGGFICFPSRARQQVSSGEHFGNH